jgi:Fe2+ or Zn2+ uptake regulation protein
MLTHEDQIIQELKRHHISVTGNRVKILSTAYRLQHNISTVTIQKAIEYTIERTSVHRALRLFCKKGVLLPVPNTNGLIEYKIIGLPIECNDQKKATFTCLQCGHFKDIVMKEALWEVPQKISIEKVIIEGLCEQCGVQPPMLIL